MRAGITIIGSDMWCRQDGGRAGADVRIALTSETLGRLQAWAQQYERAVHAGDPSLLLGLGAAMFTWLNENGWASEWSRGSGDRILDIAVQDPGAEAAAVLLDLPWELLAYEGDFLAADPQQTFVVSRSIGRRASAEPVEAAYRDLATLFMAAAPEGRQELDFENEEAAILEATSRLPVQLVVEESGCLDFLRDRLAQEGPFEAVHFSCHGDLSHDGGPVLALETPEGTLALTTPREVASALGEKKVPLVFLSACRTAESLENHQEKKATAVEPFVRALVRAGVPNVMGWDGSVYDADATLFARTFYQELAQFASVPYAAATARSAVLREHRNHPHKGQHWHLARVYTGEQGGGPLCDRAKPKRQLRKAAGYREFLDKARARVPVATAQEFVGRRRQAQAVLQAFRTAEKAGVLLYGMGQIGKSSLAARIANRLPRHETVVIYERYDGVAVFEQLLAALPASERQTWDRLWRERITEHGAALGDALEEMLSGPFDERPLLLIIDDLEQVLDTPKPTQRVTPIKEAPGQADAWRVALGGILRAFGAVETASRLLVTSRYRFTLPDGRGHDLADTLAAVHVRPMRDRERAKQWQAAQRTSDRVESEFTDEETTLGKRVLAVAGGNPGLQSILSRPILSGEHGVARVALDAVERWKTSGEVPTDESAAQEFFRRVSFETYRDALTETQKIQLRAATVFAEGLPIPVKALEAVGRAAGVNDPPLALARLYGLGLVDEWGDINGVAHAAANPLARPLAGSKLTDEEQAALATAAIEPLARGWCSTDGRFPIDSRGVEAARLALKGRSAMEVLEQAAFAAGVFLFHRARDARGALAMLEPARTRIETAGKEANLRFLLLGATCAERVGERDLQLMLLEKGLVQPSDDKVTRARIAAVHASALIGRDGPEKALAKLRDTVVLFDELRDEHSRAVAMGQIADILEQRGETDEALRIRREEQLPVYERLGDVHSRAVTMGKIADTLGWRGETDEALCILREELPVLERLGDVREWALTMGKIADILEQRGETDKVLRIRREEELPVYERLGDVRSQAVTMGKIAHILVQRGETDEALRILREELPVYERLGDVRSQAVTMGKIADILEQRGETDEALRIRREEELPVYERLGDVHSRAVTMGQIAHILGRRSETDEALRIHLEERLPIAQATKDLESLAHIRLSCAQLRLTRKDLQQGEGQTIYDELAESFAIYHKLQHVEGVAAAGWLLGQILAGGGHLDEARTVLDQSARAFEQMRQTQLAEQVRSFLRQITEAKP